VRGQRANRDTPAGFTDVAQVGNPRDVDRRPWAAPAAASSLESGYAASQHLGIVAVLREQSDRLVDGRGRW
jgi:hypothetical protein